MQASKDGPPRADVLLAGRVVPLVAGMRAHYVIEQTTGLSMTDYIDSLQAKPTGEAREISLPERLSEDGQTLLPAETITRPVLKGPSLSQFFPLLWGLTATYRAEGGQPHVLTPEDRQNGLVVPSSFVETLPTGSAWVELAKKADDLIAAAWSDPVFVPEEPPGNG
jgi:hypothetical protein